MPEMHPEGDPGYEREAVPSIRGIILLGLGLLALTAVSLVAIAFLFGFFRAERILDEQPPAPPEPRLQVSPSQDMQLYLTQQQGILSSYDWANQEAGTARIPIERAMNLVLENESFLEPEGQSPGTSESEPELSEPVPPESEEAEETSESTDEDSGLSDEEDGGNE